MTAVSCVEENWDGTSHGVKIEVVGSMPGAMAAGLLPWTGSKEQKSDMVKYENTVTLIAIARDKGCSSSFPSSPFFGPPHSKLLPSQSLGTFVCVTILTLLLPLAGRILLDASSQPRMHYTLSSYDATSLTRGTIAAAEIHLAAGAERIVTTQVDVEDFIVPKGEAPFLTNDERWKTWIKKVEAAGTKSGRCALGRYVLPSPSYRCETDLLYLFPQCTSDGQVRPSLCRLPLQHKSKLTHLTLCSCQMGTKPSSSVVDPRGRVWGTNSLYVADAVRFPSLSLPHSH
jgi:long-chain-alcohol oxidase